MQPYFFPYAGYYRLLLESDAFVVFDNAQFPRRGRVHRCQVRGEDGSTRWLTLPLERAPQQTKISHMRLVSGAGPLIESRIGQLQDISRLVRGDETLGEHLLNPGEPLLEYLCAGIRLVSGLVGASSRMLYASEILPRGDEAYQEYIINIGRELGAETYVNSPGGFELYDHQLFDKAGLELTFLPLAECPPTSVLQNWDASIRWLQGKGKSDVPAAF